ncbi:MAG: MBL fold metallo-hydrolase [bacterium]
MEIKILGADSLGVRSLSTLVRTTSRSVLIDPGVSVCPKRFGLPPHPFEIEALKEVRKAIIDSSQLADAVVITHFHHDHFSSFETRPLDLTDATTAKVIYRELPIYAKSWKVKINPAQRKRALQLIKDIGRDLIVADGRDFGDLRFSPPVKHGERKSPQGFLIMVSIADGKERMVFGSDIQLFENQSIEWIEEEKPNILIVSGPPIYLESLSQYEIAIAERNLIRLSRSIETIVVDHHLMRSLEYKSFLSSPKDIALTYGHMVLSASEFMKKPESLLEAQREQLWQGKGG